MPSQEKSPSAQVFGSLESQVISKKLEIGCLVKTIVGLVFFVKVTILILASVSLVGNFTHYNFVQILHSQPFYFLV